MTAADQALLAAILADPKDDSVRLVYADWLEEQREYAQARWIRIGLLLPPLLHAPGCWTPWACDHDRDYNPGREPGGDVWMWAGGFVCRVHCSCEDWFRHGPAVARTHPIGRVELTDLHPSRSVNESVGANVYCWWKRGRGPGSHTPPWLWEYLVPPQAECRVPRHLVTARDFPTEAAALDGLSVACLAYARDPSHAPAEDRA